MPAPLELRITDYQDATRWRWELADGQGRYLADHEVALDAASRAYRGFLSLQDYLEFYEPVRPPAEQLATLGAQGNRIKEYLYRLSVRVLHAIVNVS
jgi:hypothetical protein